MNAKKSAKREEKKEAERVEAKKASICRKRVARANYLLTKGIRQEFKKGVSAHDVFFHLMMKNIEFAVRFLKAYLPGKLLKALDLSDPGRIATLSTDFYDKRGNKHIADLIYVIPCRGEDKFVTLTVIVEHKAQSGSTVDRKTIAQLLKYVALEVEEQLQNDNIVYQPLVVLVYTGSDPDFEAPSWEESFPLPKLLRVKELRRSQIRFEPVCINLTRSFVEDKLSEEDFLRVMPEAMARASLKRLKESCSTLFSPLGQIENMTDEDQDRLEACVNYVVQTADEPLDDEDVETLRLGVNNKKVRENMKNYLDLLEERGEARGRIEGEIKGEITTIQTVARLRFPEPSRRLSSLLKKLNDLKLLREIRQFAMTASSLLDVENYAESLTQNKPKVKRVVRKQTA